MIFKILKLLFLMVFFSCPGKKSFIGSKMFFAVLMSSTFLLVLFINLYTILLTLFGKFSDIILGVLFSMQAHIYLIGFLVIFLLLFCKDFSTENYLYTSNQPIRFSDILYMMGNEEGSSGSESASGSGSHFEDHQQQSQDKNGFLNRILRPFRNSMSNFVEAQTRLFREAVKQDWKSEIEIMRAENKKEFEAIREEINNLPERKHYFPLEIAVLELTKSTDFETYQRCSQKLSLEDKATLSRIYTTLSSSNAHPEGHMMMSMAEFEAKDKAWHARGTSNQNGNIRLTIVLFTGGLMVTFWGFYKTNLFDFQRFGFWERLPLESNSNSNSVEEAYPTPAIRTIVLHGDAAMYGSLTFPLNLPVVPSGSDLVSDYLTKDQALANSRLAFSDNSPIMAEIKKSNNSDSNNNR